MPAAPIQSAADLVQSAQVIARGQLEEVEVGGRPLKLPAIGPRLSQTPGRTAWAGPALGAHTRTVLRDLLALSDDEIADLQRAGVLGGETR